MAVAIPTSPDSSPSGVTPTDVLYVSQETGVPVKVVELVRGDTREDLLAAVEFLVSKLPYLRRSAGASATREKADALHSPERLQDEIFKRMNDNGKVS